MQLPLTATPLSPEETSVVMQEAWAEVFGGRPSRAEAEWLLAFLWNENRKGQSIIQHNWGNLSTKNLSLPYWRPPWYSLESIEQMDEPRRSTMLSVHQRMLDGKEPDAFRAFSDHATGAATWLERLETRFPEILRAAKQGSAVAMQDAIYGSGYCASPLCAKNAARYQQLRDEIRAAGLFADLGKRKLQKRRRSNANAAPLVFFWQPQQGAASYG